MVTVSLKAITLEITDMLQTKPRLYLKQNPYGMTPMTFLHLDIWWLTMELRSIIQMLDKRISACVLARPWWSVR